MHFVILPPTDLGEFKNRYFVKLNILHFIQILFFFSKMKDLYFLEFYKTRWLQLMRTWVQYLGTGLSKRSSTLFSSLSSLSSSSTFSLPWSSLLSTSWERQNWRTTWTKIKSLVLISPFKPSQCSSMSPRRRQEFGNVWNTTSHYYCLPTSNSIILVYSFQLWRLCTSAPFENFILFLIILNTLLLMLKFQGAPLFYVDILSHFNLLFTLLFTIEAVLKLTSFGPKVSFSLWHSSKSWILNYFCSFSELFQGFLEYFWFHHGGGQHHWRHKNSSNWISEALPCCQAY